MDFFSIEFLKRAAADLCNGCFFRDHLDVLYITCLGIARQRKSKAPWQHDPKQRLPETWNSWSSQEQKKWVLRKVKHDLDQIKISLDSKKRGIEIFHFCDGEWKIRRGGKDFTEDCWQLKSSLSLPRLKPKTRALAAVSHDAHDQQQNQDSQQEYEAIIVHPDKAIGVVKSTLWGQVDNMEMERQTDLLLGFLKLEVHREWHSLDQQCLTPRKAVAAIIQKDETWKMTFTTEPWRGVTCDMATLRQERLKQGAAWVLRIFIRVLAFRKHTIATIESLRAIDSPSFQQRGALAEQEDALARNFSEYWAAKVIATSLLQEDPLYRISPTDQATMDTAIWDRSIRLAKLDREQIHRCRQLRILLREQVARIDRSTQELHDVYNQKMTSPLTQSTEDDLVLLFHQVQRNDSLKSLGILRTGQRFLFDILRPVQAALFYASLQVNSTIFTKHFMDWTIFGLIYEFLTCETSSRWIDEHYGNLVPLPLQAGENGMGCNHIHAMT